jgi:SAM-dependent methyltransferase
MKKKKRTAVWDASAENYDRWYKTFEGAVENHIDWQLLKDYLPKNKNARILDAAGGTGRIALPLAKQGYSVTLCDISPGMLEVAQKKILKEGVSDRVRILECDIRELPFEDDSFDFVLCWNGTAEATGELIRVTKRGGRVSIFLVSTWATAISRFHKDPDFALDVIDSAPRRLEEEGSTHWAVHPEEAAGFFEAMGIRVLDIFAVCGWVDVLRIPDDTAKSRHWDETLFKQTTRMVMKLCRERSVRGVTRHLVMYGDKL